MERAGRERDDQKLIDRIRGRDAGALAAIFRHYYPRVYAFAMRRLHTPARAEAIASEVFFEAWQSVGAFRGGSSIASWIYGIAHFKCIGARRRGRSEWVAATRQRGAKEGGMAGKCPEGVLTLIPWYRELDADDRGIVEAHAAGCAACRCEVEMVAGGPLPPTPFPDRDAAFSKLMDRIQDAEQHGREPSAHARGWRIAAFAAAGIFLVALGFAISHFSWSGHSLTSISVATGPPYTSLNVVFREGVSPAQIEYALASVDAVLVSGPNPVGRYLIAVPPGIDPRQVAGFLLAGTRDHPDGIATSVSPRSH